MVFAEARLTPPSRSIMGRRRLDIASIDGVDRSTAAQSFAQAALGRDLLLYIHGYRESFETAATSTIELSEGIRFPGATGLFTWPSAGSTFSYVSDRESAMWSRDALEDLLSAIAKIAERRAHPHRGAQHGNAADARNLEDAARVRR